MADNPIKSVRVRKNIAAQTSVAEQYGELDLKVSIYKFGFGGNKRRVKATDNLGNSIPGREPLEYATSGRYADFTDDDFIKDFLDVQAKSQPPNKSTVSISTSNGVKEVPVYEIIQDPWDQNKPIKRNFGNQPYFLKDGSKVMIKWTRRGDKNFGEEELDGDFHKEIEAIDEGGIKWSDDKGKEKDEIVRPDGKTLFSSKIWKTVRIETPNGKNLVIGWKYDLKQRNADSVGDDYRERKNEYMHIIKESDSVFEFEKKNSLVHFSEEDRLLLYRLGEIWRDQLFNLGVKDSKYGPDFVCRLPDDTPNYDACNRIEGQGIDYVDPLDGKEKETPPEKKEEEKSDIKPTDNSPTNATGNKIKLFVKIPSDQVVKANIDISFPIEIFVGKEPDTNYRPIDGLEPVLEDEEEGLDPEFIEDQEAQIESLSQELAYIQNNETLRQMTEDANKEAEKIKNEQKKKEEEEKEKEKEDKKDDTKPPSPPPGPPVTATSGFFKGAKKSTIPLNSTENGIGYPALAQEKAFADKHSDGVYPCVQESDGTWKISYSQENEVAKAEIAKGKLDIGDLKNGGKGIKNFVLSIKQKEEKKNPLAVNRHWLVNNPEYVAKLIDTTIYTINGDKKVQLHPEMAPKVKAAMEEIKKQDLVQYIVKCGGGLAIRNTTNLLRLTNHSWGYALDLNNDIVKTINPKTGKAYGPGWEYGHKLDRVNKKVYIGKEFVRDFNDFDNGFIKVVDVMTSHGLGWLGMSDPMHFSLYESDSRLKTNIKQIGKSNSGIRIYEFEYIKEKGVKYQGVMAQDLIGTQYESSVVIYPDGFYRVDYSNLDVEFKRID